LYGLPITLLFSYRSKLLLALNFFDFLRCIVRNCASNAFALCAIHMICLKYFVLRVAKLCWNSCVPQQGQCMDISLFEAHFANLLNYTKGRNMFFYGCRAFERLVLSRFEIVEDKCYPPFSTIASKFHQCYQLYFFPPSGKYSWEMSLPLALSTMT